MIENILLLPNDSWKKIVVGKDLLYTCRKLNIFKRFKILHKFCHILKVYTVFNLISITLIYIYFSGYPPGAGYPGVGGRAPSVTTLTSSSPSLASTVQENFHAGGANRPGSPLTVQSGMKVSYSNLIYNFYQTKIIKFKDSVAITRSYKGVAHFSNLGKEWVYSRTYRSIVSFRYSKQKKI